MKLLLESKSERPPRVRNKVEVALARGVGTFVTFHGLADTEEHVAITFGNWEKQEAPLVRIHSACITGDVFKADKCSCSELLNRALIRLQKESGILLYLRQEGRGNGLYNKLDAYALQSFGYDAHEANQMLNLPDDARNYLAAAQMLVALGVQQIRLLSNSSDKKDQIERYGVQVESL